MVLRSPVAWDRQTEGEAPADQPKGKYAAPDPASSAALVIVLEVDGVIPAEVPFVTDRVAGLLSSTVDRYAIVMSAAEDVTE